MSFTSIIFYLFISSQPSHFEEVVKEKHWVTVTNQEIDSIEKNHTREIADLPKEKTRIDVKWVYTTKLNENGKIEKHKARLVAK